MICFKFILMPPKVPPVQNITFDKPSSYKVKSVFLTFITKVWRPLLYHLTNPLYVLKTFLLYHNSQKVSRYFIYYICKEFRQVFIS